MKNNVTPHKFQSANIVLIRRPAEATGISLPHMGVFLNAPRNYMWSFDPILVDAYRAYG